MATEKKNKRGGKVKYPFDTIEKNGEFFIPLNSMAVRTVSAYVSLKNRLLKPKHFIYSRTSQRRHGQSILGFLVIRDK